VTAGCLHVVECGTFVHQLYQRKLETS
jgi:hypothetical protein